LKPLAAALQAAFGDAVLAQHAVAIDDTRPPAGLSAGQKASLAVRASHAALPAKAATARPGNWIAAWRLWYNPTRLHSALTGGQSDAVR
jgi:hypothetical protein